MIKSEYKYYRNIFSKHFGHSTLISSYIHNEIGNNIYYDTQIFYKDLILINISNILQNVTLFNLKGHMFKNQNCKRLQNQSLNTVVHISL